MHAAKDVWIRVAHTENPRILRHRYGAVRIWSHIEQRVTWNLRRREEARNMPVSAQQTHGIPTPDGLPTREEMHVVSPRLGSFNASEICIDDICGNCTYLERVIDDLVDLLCLCLEDLERGVDIAKNFTGTAQIERFQRVYESATPYSASPRYASTTSKARTKTRLASKSSSSSNGGSLSGGIVDVIIDFFEWFFSLFGLELDILSSVEGVLNFFTITDPDDKRGFVFWVEFALRCDVKEHTRCDLGPPGIGLEEAFFRVTLIYVAVFVGIAIFLQPLSGLPFFLFWVTWPFIILSAAYFMSPMCFLMHPPLFVPLLPNCLADDLFVIFRQGDVECLEWNKLPGLDGITTERCGNESTDFRRPFLDCTEEPYSFDGTGVRNFFYALQRQAPKFHEFLLETDIILFSWIREVDEFRAAQAFPPELATNETLAKEFKACATITALAWGPFAAIVFVFLGLFVIFGLVALILLSILFALLALFLRLLEEFFMRLAYLGNRRKRFWVHPSELPQGVPSIGTTTTSVPAQVDVMRMTMADSLQGHAPGTPMFPAYYDPVRQNSGQLYPNPQGFAWQGGPPAPYDGTMEKKQE